MPTIMRNKDRVAIVAGIILFIVMLQFNAWESFFNKTTTYFRSESRSVAAPPLNESPKENEDEGWHPVYVYGKQQTVLHGGEDRHREFPNGSQVEQDKMVLKLIAELDRTSSPHAKNHYFVDLAANDAEILSNTLLLEDNGWEGLCIEPNPIYWYHLGALRKCSIAAAFVGGKEDMVPVDVSLSNGVYGGIVGEGMDNKPANNKAQLKKRYSVSLPTVFNKFKVPHVIDYLSLDVEGAESLIMKDFPFKEYKIKIMTVERPRQDLREILTDNGYIYVMDLSKWGETLWVHNSTGLTVEEVKEIVG
eukprot:CAMPEP_0172421200 /NCGR_PEP_ID=MMETSP1064-20121228/7474_1 /TAXON_ID=202472 /ORGANISM="Aulacoseira subarctica , Strain CCAP 1002/5" /LENGTH=304 /DNA_ID=CAMNT_0013161485 /DNA_START=52 /DNA_END=966 /DNA_ORIENTATION=+